MSHSHWNFTWYNVTNNFLFVCFSLLLLLMILLFFLPSHFAVPNTPVQMTYFP